MSELSAPSSASPGLPLTLEAAHQEILALRAGRPAEPAPTAAGSYLAALLATLPDGILLLDGTNHVVLVNDAWCQLLELNASAAALVGLAHTALAPRIAQVLADPASYQAAVQSAWEWPEKVVSYSFPLRLRSGRALKLDFLPYTDQHGQQLKMLRCCDVTERQHIEAQLLTLARIPEQNPNPVLRYSRDRQRIYANHAAEKLAAELPDNQVQPLRNQLHDWCAVALASRQTGRYELKVDQRYFNSCLVPNAAEDYVSIYLVEVTDLKHIQHALADREKRYRDLQHYTQAVICTHTLDGTVLSANPALTNMLGYSEEELIGRNVASVMPAADVPVFHEYLRHIEQAGETQGVQRVKPRDSNQLYHLLYHSVLVRDAEPPYAIVHSHDISARVESEKTLRRAKREAENAALARTNFLANMSHEIRTPLNGVLGIAARLDRTPLNTQQHELVGIIRTSGQHLLTVINDVLDIAKITSGKLELNLESFNLCDSMGQAVQPLLMQASEKGIQVQGTLLRESCPYPWVRGDAHRLNQILINLVSNAIKFTPAGGRINIVGQLLSETADSLTVEFRVTDTGIGIAPDKLEHIFENFTQAYADTARNFGGTGLGLSISQALVQQMGGTLTVQSEVGKGSTFAFQLTLPRTTAGPAVAPAAEYDTGALRGRRLLLVEDNEINRVVARMLLEEWGVVLDEAGDGPEALAKFDHTTYDLVLMDIQLPGMNGMEVTAALRRHADPARAAVPIVALTANAFSSDTEQYLAAGMNDCVAKPFEETLLFEKLVRLLTATPAAAPPPAPLYDLAQLRALSRGKAAFVHTLVRSFLNNVPATLLELRAAAAAADWPDVARLVHHIKPNLVAFGISQATPLVAELEQMRFAEPGTVDAGRAHTAVAELERLLEQVLAVLPAELPTPA